MIKVFCDVCGCEISSGELSCEVTTSEKYVDRNVITEHDFNLTLCMNCANRIYAIFEAKND